MTRVGIIGGGIGGLDCVERASPGPDRVAVTRPPASEGDWPGVALQTPNCECGCARHLRGGTPSGGSPGGRSGSGRGAWPGRVLVQVQPGASSGHLRSVWATVPGRLLERACRGAAVAVVTLGKSLR